MHASKVFEITFQINNQIFSSKIVTAVSEMPEIMQSASKIGEYEIFLFLFYKNKNCLTDFRNQKIPKLGFFVEIV